MRGLKLGMGLVLAVISALQASAEPPKWGPSEMQEGVRTGFEIAADPTTWNGKQVTVACLLLMADLRAAQCPVWNSAGKAVGVITVRLAEASVEDRKRVAEACTSMENNELCAALVSGKIEVDYGTLRLMATHFAWMR